MRTIPTGLYCIHPGDNVATALADCFPGPVPLVGAGSGLLELTQPVAQGHKAALAPIGRGQPVMKYGRSIGVALRDIAPGERGDEANLTSAVGLVREGDVFRPGGKTVYELPIYSRPHPPQENAPQGTCPARQGGDSHD